MALMKTNLLNFNHKQMRSFFRGRGDKPYRATHLLKWIHCYGVTDFEQMTNLSKALREELQQCCEINLPEVALEQKSKDGTIKWMLKLNDGNCIETVFIPEEGRGTLCVSSQVGCALNCTFCSTARQGFNRNLTVAEIIGQVWIAVRQLSKENGAHDKAVTNVVMMGMGEPLLNYDNVIMAMDLMMDDYAYGLSKKRVTLSTSGVVPAMKKLSKESEASLAVSLHAANDELRNQLVPINKKYNVEALMDVCRNYFDANSRRVITFEYVMLAGVNDSLDDAKKLTKILRDVPGKVNLIPFNPFPGANYTCSDEDTINRFREVLQAHKIVTVTRKTRGADIAAACGQLVGKVDDRTQRSKKLGLT